MNDKYNSTDASATEEVSYSTQEAMYQEQAERNEAQIQRMECIRQAVKLAVESNEAKSASDILRDAKKFAKFVLNK